MHDIVCRYNLDLCCTCVKLPAGILPIIAVEQVSAYNRTRISDFNLCTGGHPVDTLHKRHAALREIMRWNLSQYASTHVDNLHKRDIPAYQ